MVSQGKYQVNEGAWKKHRGETTTRRIHDSKGLETRPKVAYVGKTCASLIIMMYLLDDNDTLVDIII